MKASKTEHYQIENRAQGASKEMLQQVMLSSKPPLCSLLRDIYHPQNILIFRAIK